MGFYQLTSAQKIPASLDEVWKFISAPDNLKRITPAYMGFQITSKQSTERMYEGMIISYKVSPIPFLPINLTWVTEITHVKDKVYFVDEQRIGPYSLWHHQHQLTEIDGGVLMEDIVSYEPPFSILGDIANFIFIKHQLKGIFDFRFKAVEEIFGKWEGWFWMLFF